MEGDDDLRWPVQLFDYVENLVVIFVENCNLPMIYGQMNPLDCRSLANHLIFGSRRRITTLNREPLE